MKSLQANLKRIRDLLNATNASGKVYHYTKPDGVTAPWVVWQESGETDSFHADNHKDTQQVSGMIDCFTQNEYDPLLDQIQAALDLAPGVGWSLESVQYEDETKLIHYEWSFRIA